MKLVDRLTDLLDGGVDVVNRGVEPRLKSEMTRHVGSGLQRQAGREQALDDVVVHVAGDPIPVVQHGHQGPVTLSTTGKQSESCLLREVGQPRHRLPRQVLRFHLPRDDEDANVAVARRQR